MNQTQQLKQPSLLPQTVGTSFRRDIIDLFLGIKTAHLSSHTFRHGAALWEDFFNSPSDYYVARDEIELIRANALSIRKLCAGTRNIIDLGPGSAGAVEKKTLPILKSLEFSAERYFAVDVSDEYLTGAGGAVRAAFPDIAVTLVNDNFFNAPQLPVDARTLALLLGITVSNMPGIHDKETGIKFLREEMAIFRSMLPVGAYFLCSYDTCQNEEKLLRAYDHPKHGKFIANIASAIKSELAPDSEFDDKAWVYRPRWDAKNHMFKHIVTSTEDMSLILGERSFMLPEGYEILSYVSVKFPEDIYLQIFKEAGFSLAQTPFKGPDGDINLAILEAV